MAIYTVRRLSVYAVRMTLRGSPGGAFFIHWTSEVASLASSWARSAKRGWAESLLASSLEGGGVSV